MTIFHLVFTSPHHSREWRKKTIIWRNQNLCENFLVSGENQNVENLLVWSFHHRHISHSRSTCIFQSFPCFQTFSLIYIPLFQFTIFLCVSILTKEIRKSIFSRKNKFRKLNLIALMCLISRRNHQGVEN